MWLKAALVYRSGRVLKHNVLTLPSLPEAYYIGGDYKEHCTVIRDEITNTINYCEDITFWDHLDEQNHLARRFVLLGCDPNRKAWNTVMGPLHDPEPFAYLWLYSTESGSLQPITLNNYPMGHDFHPLGMEVYPSKDGAPSNLFIVNHARANTTIEQFVLDPTQPTTATYVRTVSSPYFISPNSVALTSSTSFYVSNDHLMTRRLPGPLGKILPVVESLAALPLSWLAHVAISPDGVLQHKIVAFGVPFANGVAVSHDGSQVALSSTTLGEVYFYDRNLSTNDLKLSHSVPVPFLPDNIMYADDGALIVTGHPHFPSVAAVAANKTGAKAGSWSVSLRPISDTTHTKSEKDFVNRAYDLRAPLSASAIAPAVLTHEVETLFQSDGSVFGTSATSLVDARTGTLYMSGLYEEGILVCGPK
ncbi:hypothetical protein EDC04DRAFT_2871441 [Pisolithus marmoratus]|nr:hypothetical protein EDC04DRAFT_2871441 [Pisolithus marmoratus]